MYTVHQELVVQMRSGGQSGGTYVANYLPLRNFFSGFDAPTELPVQILGHKLLTVANDDVVAVYTVTRCLLYSSSPAAKIGVPRGAA